MKTTQFLILLFLWAVLPHSVRAIMLRPPEPAGNHLRISLLTCGPGNEFIGASFGHTAIRIIDSVAGTDEAYNYGTFDFDAPNFELRFAQGKMTYLLAKSSYAGFMQEYFTAGRSVLEQELNLSPAERAKLRTLLEDNLLPDNRGYIYSSVYDNCATRVRDLLRRTLGDSLKYGTSIPNNPRLTFRDAWNEHLTGEVWERFGINILTGTHVDKVMTNEQAMFLPEYLSNAFAGATFKGRPLVLSSQKLLPQRLAIPKEPSIDPPFWVMLAVSILVIACQVLPRLQRTGMIAGRSLLAVTGLFGCLMVIMWVGTDHKICENNLNLLWALPTNLIAGFKRRNISRYAIVALGLIGISLVLHIARVQVLPLANLWPVLLALIVTFGTIYRRERKVSPAK